MRRRTLVAAVGSGAIALSGCLFDDSGGDTGTETNDSGGDSETETGDSDGDTEPSNETGQSDGEDPPEGSTDRRYEECPREVITYEQFPAEIQAEIDAALEGRYEDDRVFLREAMDTEASYVSVDERYYDPGVTEDGDEEVLTLELVEPKALPEARPVNVEHALDGERTIALDVVAEDGTVLIDETRSLRSTSTVEFGETARVGVHEVRVSVEDSEAIEAELTGTLRIDESRFDRIVVVEPDGLSVTGAVAELGTCRFGG